MKWSKPAGGDTRTVRRFLWVPMRLGSETRWLEFAKWEETYFVGAYIDDHWKPIGGWL